MTVNREHIEMARALHEKHFVSDAHFDLLPLIWIGAKGERPRSWKIVTSLPSDREA